MKPTTIPITPCILLTGLLLSFAGPAQAQQDDLRITEFMAANSQTLADEDKEYPDWIEIYNAGTNTVNLLNWCLTDSSKTLTKWQFPATNLPPNQFLVVFASEKDRRTPGAPLHTNFKLGGDGEYLALVKPGGETIASEFRPEYPRQFAGVSFGLPITQIDVPLILSNSGVRVLVPTNGLLATTWAARDLDDSTWLPGAGAVGYDTGGVNPGEDLATSIILASTPTVFLRFNEPNAATVATNSISGGANGSYTAVTKGVAGVRPPAQGGFEADNTAAQFGGAGYATLNSTLLNNRSAFTMSAWVRPSANQAARTGLFGQNDVVEFGFIDAATLQVWTPGGGSLNVSWTLGINQWVHVAVVGDGASLKIYLNGTQAGSGGSSTANYGSSTYNVNIGGGGVFDTISANGNYFNGQIDEFGLWTRALTADEIRAQYNAALSPTAGITYNSLITTDIQTQMLGANSSAYLRYGFDVPDPSIIDRLLLSVRYDDGFVAYLNGNRVASANAPLEPAWDSTATMANPDGTALSYQVINISSSVGYLQPGHNVLAIQALNTSATNTDFLVQAELRAMDMGNYGTQARYFTQATPGDHNGEGTVDLGPFISNARHTPEPPVRPNDEDDITVTVRVEPTFYPVTSVTLNWRVMYGDTNQLAMLDDGLHGDGAAGDGVFGAAIPASASTNGQMVRWYITANDSANRVSRWPLFEDPLNSAEYLGTAVANPGVTSDVPIFELFMPPIAFLGAAPNNIDDEGGARVSLFYDGELYDNIHMERRGNTTAAYRKKNHRVNFNADKPFKHPGADQPVRHTSFMAEHADPAYLRQHLSFWLMNKMGVPAPFDYPIRLQTNGVFYKLAFHNDVVHSEQVERLGYNPGGALYKAAGTVTPNHSSTGGFEKKTRLWEDTADFDAMANGINEARTPEQRRTYIFDNLNIPEIVNYLAVARFVVEGDDVWANMCLYRDTLGNKEWSIIPFDMNVSWGQLYCGDDTTNLRNIIADIDDTTVGKAHPLYGGSEVRVGTRDYNRIYDVIIDIPETRQMLLRRMRTLLDTYVLPPGTPFRQGIIEQHIAKITNSIWAEANFLDRQKWGWPCDTVGTACGMYCWGNNQWMTNSVDDLVNKFLNPRRRHWYSTHSITNTAKAIGVGNALNAGIPLTQPANAYLQVFAVEASPASGNQAQEWLSLTNPTPLALDISDWKVEGAIQFTFQPGTILPSNGVVYLSPDVNAFRARTTGPRAGQGLFVQGGYKGQLSARGEGIIIKDPKGRVVNTNSYAGNPSLAQQFLRITELMYFPAPQAGSAFAADEFEFIELKNTGSESLDLTGVNFANGVAFTFTGSAVTNLAAGQTVLVVKNIAAFTQRYGAGLNIAGQYTGSLDNQGERITLLDASGEEILDFSYNDTWASLSDGFGFSLVAADENAEPDLWDNRLNWRSSSQLGGSPAVVDPAPPAIAAVRINEALSRTDMPPPTDSIELFNPTAAPADVSGWYLSDDFNAPKKFRIPNGTIIPTNGYVVFNESQFNPTPGVPPSFALSSDGDEVHLFSADAAGNLTGYYDGFTFGAAENGVTFGRHVTSTGEEHFIAQSASTLGAANAGPRVGPVVISEIMYRPLDLGSGNDAENEYIELLNISSQPVALFDAAAPTNTWKITGGVDYVLPDNLTLAAGEYLLLVNFDATNTALADAFRARYGIPANVRIFGPYANSLNNAGADVELKKPGLSPLGAPVFVMMDQVEYTDATPWPAGADGSGLSLQRIDVNAYANDPANWVAAPPTAGGARSPGGTLPAITQQPASLMVVAGQTASLTVQATGSAPLQYQWRLNGDNLPGATNVTLEIPNVTIDQMGDYSVVVYNSQGSVVSSNSVLTVQMEAAILAQPTSVKIKPANTVTFRVLALSSTPMQFQWRQDGNPIAGATGSSITISNVSLANRGLYDVVITDAIGPVTSDPAELVLLIDPVVTQQPQSVTLAVGDTLSLTAEVTNSATLPVDYRWRRNGSYLVTNKVAALQNTLVVPNLTLINAGTYNVVPANDSRPGGWQSTNAFVTVVDLPKNRTAVIGSPTTFTVAIGNPGSLTRQARMNVQWLFNGADLLTAIPSATVSTNSVTNSAVVITTNTITIPNVQESLLGDYGVRISVFTNVTIAPVTFTAKLSLGAADSDNDGMPDAWENAHACLNSGANDAAADADNDSMSNLAEYQAGTDPCNSQSYLRIEQPVIGGTGATNVILRFTAVANQTYSVLYQDAINPSTNWTKLQDVNSAPTNRVAEVIDTQPSTARRFYRLATPIVP